jgi:hypothetical protein
MREPMACPPFNIKNLEWWARRKGAFAHPTELRDGIREELNPSYRPRHHGGAFCVAVRQFGMEFGDRMFHADGKPRQKAVTHITRGRAQ